MKKALKDFLTKAANEIPVRLTDITHFKQTVVDTDKTFTSGGKLKKATMQTMSYKAGSKPIDRFRIVKKAYAEGGVNKVIEVVNGYRSQLNRKK